MSERTLPPEIRRFIVTSVPSVPYLEALLLLRTEPGMPWDCQRVARRLYLGERQAQELLEALAASGIATPYAPDPSCFVFHPESPQLAALLDELAAQYSANLVLVTGLIHSRIDKQAQQFADAFRWRKD